ncbi:hypothetical protein GCM10009411_36620 [Shewanella litoralis]|uniref:Uncharacterized protein n=1 Tax=Shewanella litoralis TaxID=2282700 RepID=A0ABQ2RMD8_9GAMM|nr:hypothetical protein GCM10009411_36620 [Shewanella litoralis]
MKISRHNVNAIVMELNLSSKSSVKLIIGIKQNKSIKIGKKITLGNIITFAKLFLLSHS